MPDSIPETGETILVVDDNEAVLQTVVAILARVKYRVLSAHISASAIKLSSETETKIDLLLSDVDMSLMSGPELGEQLKKTGPDLHVMSMSGGANGSLLVLNYGWAFIEKPSCRISWHGWFRTFSIPRSDLSLAAKNR